MLTLCPQPVLHSLSHLDSLRSRLQTCVLRCNVALVLASLLSGVASAGAQEQPASLGPGDKAAAWTDVTGVDGKQHSLNDLSAQSVVVVCFTSNTCPYSVDYEDRMIALQKSWQDAGLPVTLVAINSNAVNADDLAAMKVRAEEKKFNFAYLKDESQEIAKAWGALYTPEFFVLNQERQIVFRGAMDDQTDASRVTENYVSQAVEAALKGQMPKVTEVPARGCAVRYKRSRR